MKKVSLFFTISLFFILCSCNDDNSANRNNTQDASNTSMDELGPAKNRDGDTAKSNATPRVNINQDAKNTDGNDPNAHGNKNDQR